MCNCRKCFCLELSKELLENVDCIETIKQLVLNGANINYQTKSGWNVLFESVSSGLNEHIAELVKLGCNINSVDKNGQNALYWAIYHNDIKTARVLIDLGIDKSVDVAPGIPAVQYALDKNNIQMVDCILNYKNYDHIGL